MAKNMGLIQFSGTIGGITGVNSKEGHHIRAKKDIPASTYATSPSYVDFRENGKAWGESSRLRKSFLDGFKLFVQGCSNPRMYSRMTGVMGRIIKSDTVSRKGEFKAVNGIVTEKGKEMLNGFEFNRDCSLSSVLHETYVVDRDSGSVSIDGFVAKKWIKAPKGATHVVLQAGIYRYDFGNGVSSFMEGEGVTFEVKSKEVNDLVFDVGIPEGEGTVVFLLRVLFFQQVNGKLYALNGVKGGCMKVIDCC